MGRILAGFFAGEPVGVAIGKFCPNDQSGQARLRDSVSDALEMPANTLYIRLALSDS
jgi:hypothetical protein